jgi:DNA-directed RNA polymerase subunit RPC12/RpoP
MTRSPKLTEAERAEAVAAIDAEIARLQAERAQLVPQLTRCVECWHEVEEGLIDRNGECADCSATYEDPNEEHRQAFYRNVAGGCS